MFYTCLFHIFIPIFHHDAKWFKWNFQHESGRSLWILQLCIRGLMSKKCLDLRYEPMKSWHYCPTLREIFNRFWSGFYPNFLALFHIVPRWFCQNGQHESYRGWIYHTWARRFKGLKLDIHSWIASHFVEGQIIQFAWCDA